MEELNEGQRRICENRSTHILVIAGPGTGKTYSIAQKVVQILKEGEDPSSIICITFTNRAAMELRERVKSLISKDLQDLFVGTIHKLGLTFLKEHTKKDIKVIDRETQEEILKGIVGDERRAKHELKKIERIKGKLFFEGKDEIYEKYEAELRKNELYDYEDLILKPCEILESMSPRKRIRYIIVDEFQDLNRAQYEFVSKIAELSRSLICAVGDADQSIYGFRGSDVRIFLDFEKDYPQCQVVRLNENYRSTKTIIEASTSLIKKNLKRFENEIIAKRNGGPPVKIVRVPYPFMAGDFIVKEIEKRIGGLSHLSTSKGDSLKGERRLSFSDFAVIFRTNEDVNLVKKSFEMSGIPYQIIGGRLEGQTDPLRRLMEKIASSLSESNEEGLKGLSLRQFLDVCPFKEANESIIELVEGFFPFTPIGELLSELNLITPLDDYNPSFDSVTLTTMHRAKGLEFSCVFILGLEEGNIPFSRSKDYDIEEERRLLYVGMTRAKDELFLIRSKRGVPSHFLKEIPPELTETIDIGLKKKPKTLSLFDLCK